MSSLCSIANESPYHVITVTVEQVIQSSLNPSAQVMVVHSRLRINTCSVWNKSWALHLTVVAEYMSRWIDGQTAPSPMRNYGLSEVRTPPQGLTIYRKWCCTSAFLQNIEWRPQAGDTALETGWALQAQLCFTM